MSEGHRDQVKINNAIDIILLFTRISRLTTARAPRASHIWLREQEFDVNGGTLDVGREPSLCRPICSFLNPQLREQVNIVHVVVSPLRRGPSNIQKILTTRTGDCSNTIVPNYKLADAWVCVAGVSYL